MSVRKMNENRKGGEYFCHPGKKVNHEGCGCGPMGCGPTGCVPMKCGPMVRGPMKCGPTECGPIKCSPMGCGPLKCGTKCCPMKCGPLGLVKCGTIKRRMKRTSRKYLLIRYLVQKNSPLFLSKKNISYFKWIGIRDRWYLTIYYLYYLLINTNVGNKNHFS